ncbi:protein bicaudal C homolog 1 isoform X5 [Procambarus clarkii]|uniref:protein bicaudal C homolog 1 isoform X5 n=2 Tax=Procambarus clarkii TaxID=6728 RepID=UPI001E672775|nr:protein bicaudal C homolog 1-like isoform X1 [Procambarus clarkii]
MGPHDQLEQDDVSEVYSEGSLSRCNSTEKMTFTVLADGLVEERFRVDRRKLEAMILGCPSDPCDLEIMKLPIASDGRVLSADDFFQGIMEDTKTEIKYPKFLKVGARNKKDPHVRVVGLPEAVRLAGAMVRQELEPHNKVTMKLDVSWTHHSHIIGKGGNTIQPVVKRTGVSIHFPDGNKNSEVRKSNQVSINSRGEELAGLEEARGAIRELTPLIFTFSLSASAQFISISDPNMLIIHVENTYNVQVDLKLTDDISPLIVGSVRGSEWDAVRVKEATLYILQAYCDTLAQHQMPVQMTVEISPQHHSFVLGRNNETLKRIMQRTATKITFPDSNDLSLPPLKKSTVTISGAIDNVYLARQNIVGALPLVLMFDLMPDQTVDSAEVSQIMQTLDVNIIIKNKRLDGRRPVIIKGAERNAGNIYEAWRILARADKAPPKVQIPPTYHIPDAAPLYGLTTDLNLGQWLGGGSGGSSPLPSPTGTPSPQVHASAPWSSLSPSSSQLPSHFSRTQYSTMLFEPSSSYYSANLLLRSSSFNCNNNNSNVPNNNCITSKQTGGLGMSSGVNLNSLVSGLSGMALSNGVEDASCGTSSNSGSSLSSPAPSPRDASPDQIINGHMSSTSHQSQYADAESATTNGMNAISALLTDIDRRAPGCEKKRIEMAAQKMTSLSDYSSKKVQAAKAMKEQVDSSPRTPTSSWSGYGFSKSMPGFMIRQKMQENRLLKTNQGGLEGWEEWQQQEAGAGDFSSSQAMSSLHYPSRMTQLGQTSLGTSDNLMVQRQPFSLSSSNYMDCVLPRPRESACHTSQQSDITSVLTDLKLEQYIDVFVAQEVDINMFVSLNDTDLKELGIQIFGHRRKILMAIRDLSTKKPFFFGGVGAVKSGVDRTSAIRETTSTWE